MRSFARVPMSVSPARRPEVQRLAFVGNETTVPRSRSTKHCLVRTYIIVNLMAWQIKQLYINPLLKVYVIVWEWEIIDYDRFSSNECWTRFQWQNGRAKRWKWRGFRDWTWARIYASPATVYHRRLASRSKYRSTVSIILCLFKDWRAILTLFYEEKSWLEIIIKNIRCISIAL